MNIGDRVQTYWGLTGTIIDTCGVAGGLPNYLIRMDASAYTSEGQEICYMQKHLTVIEGSSPALDPARGQIEITTVPSSVEHRALFDIDTKIRNTGGSTGTFRVQMFMNGVIQRQSSQFSLAAGAVSGFKSLQATAPTSGTSMTYDIKCIRIS